MRAIAERDNRTLDVRDSANPVERRAATPSLVPEADAPARVERRIRLCRDDGRTLPSVLAQGFAFREAIEPLEFPISLIVDALAKQTDRSRRRRKVDGHT
jgi:hypothetical protein